MSRFVRALRPILSASLLAVLLLDGLLPFGGVAWAQGPITTAEPPGPAAAPAPKSDTHQVTVLGLGMTSCEGWMQLRPLDAGNLAEQWMLGFLSGGAAFGGSNYLGATNLPDVLKLVSNYCAANPHAPLAAATVEVAKELEAPMGRTVVHP